ncbi:hypothetical protein [Streptomyces sp. NPDC008137]|uniref:hypothetical protein n=1 Tax=Streptomyces sp. NPDC008137 TaxID=3364813 RepID=UPI0036E17C3B
MSPFLFSADLASTDLGQHVRATTTVADAMAELFGDDFSRALWRETAYAVPLAERSTCPIHLDWVTGCAELHLDYPAAA